MQKWVRVFRCYPTSTDMVTDRHDEKLCHPMRSAQNTGQPANLLKQCYYLVSIMVTWGRCDAPQIYCANTIPQNLVKMQILTQQVWGEAWDSTFLISCWSMGHVLSSKAILNAGIGDLIWIAVLKFNSSIQMDKFISFLIYKAGVNITVLERCCVK